MMVQGSLLCTYESKTLRVDADFLNREKKISVLENTRLHVNGQIRFKNATCGRRHFLNKAKKSPFSKLTGLA